MSARTVAFKFASGFAVTLIWIGVGCGLTILSLKLINLYGGYGLATIFVFLAIVGGFFAAISPDNEQRHIPSPPQEPRHD